MSNIKFEAVSNFDDCIGGRRCWSCGGDCGELHIHAMPESDEESLFGLCSEECGIYFVQHWDPSEEAMLGAPKPL